VAAVNVSIIESVQRNFIKRLSGFGKLSYESRLAVLNTLTGKFAVSQVVDWSPCGLDSLQTSQLAKIFDTKFEENK